MTKNAKTALILILLAIFIALIPLFLVKDAEFGGTDDAGSQMIAETIGEEYEPWFEPVLETWLGRGLPSEVESLFFCIQTGIGVGIIAYCFGYLVARKKYSGREAARK